jgi:hypothetical protein
LWGVGFTSLRSRVTGQGLIFVVFGGLIGGHLTEVNCSPPSSVRDCSELTDDVRCDGHRCGSFGGSQERKRRKLELGSKARVARRAYTREYHWWVTVEGVTPGVVPGSSHQWKLLDLGFRV